MPLLVAVVSLVTVVAFESLAISTVMPLVEDDLGELRLYGWVFSAFYLGTLVGVVVGGNVVDRVRPVGPMMLGVAVFMGGLVAGGLAPSMEILVAGRFVQGLGAGVVPAVSYVVVARGFPESLHPKVFAAMSAAWVTPALISPLMASVIARHFSWRWVFLGLVPITLCVAAVGAPAVARVGRSAPGGSPVEGARTDDTTLDTRRRRGGAEPSYLVRVFLLTAGAAAALVGMGMEELILGIPLAILGLAVMVPAFIALTPPGTLSARPRLPATILIRGLLTYSFFSSDAFLSLGVTSVRHRTTIYAGFALVGSSIAWSVGSWIQARLLSRAQGSSDDGIAMRAVWSRLVSTGALLLLVGAIGMVASLNSHVPVAIWVLSSTTMGLGMGLAYTTISVAALAEAEPGREGQATSALQLSDILGVALGTGVGGVMVAVGSRFADSNSAALTGVFVGSALLAAVTICLAPRLSGGVTDRSAFG